MRMGTTLRWATAPTIPHMTGSYLFFFGRFQPLMLT